MSRGKDPKKKYDCCFGGYIGRNRFQVWHPDGRRVITVAAPDDNAALYAAAKFWNEDWGDFDFYGRVQIYKI